MSFSLTLSLTTLAMIGPPFRPPSRTFASRVNNLQVNGVRRAEDPKVWLREVGAYPVIAILTFACGFCATIGTRTLMKNTDVRIAPSKRQQLIRTWD